MLCSHDYVVAKVLWWRYVSTLFLHLFRIVCVCWYFMRFWMVFLCARATHCFGRFSREKKVFFFRWFSLFGEKFSSTYHTFWVFYCVHFFTSRSVKMKQQQPKSFISLIINTLLSLGPLDVFLFSHFNRVLYIFMYICSVKISCVGILLQ